MRLAFYCLPRGSASAKAQSAMIGRLRVRRRRGFSPSTRRRATTTSPPICRGRESDGAKAADPLESLSPPSETCLPRRSSRSKEGNSPRNRYSAPVWGGVASRVHEGDGSHILPPAAQPARNAACPLDRDGQPPHRTDMARQLGPAPMTEIGVTDTGRAASPGGSTIRSMASTSRSAPLPRTLATACGLPIIEPNLHVFRQNGAPAAVAQPTASATATVGNDNRRIIASPSACNGAGQTTTCCSSPRVLRPYCSVIPPDGPRRRRCRYGSESPDGPGRR